MVSVDRRMLAPTKLTQASSGSKLNERITKRVRTVLPVVIISHCRSIINFMICDVFLAEFTEVLSLVEQEENRTDSKTTAGKGTTNVFFIPSELAVPFC
jgi:hypothetical protein